MKKLFTLIFIFTCLNSFTQKKILDHSDFNIWNRIQSPQIASEGNHILYSIQTGEKDSKLMLKDKQGNLIFHHDRSENGVFTYDSKFALFKIKEWKDDFLHGFWRLFFIDGTLRLEGSHNDNLRDGRQTCYHPNGKVYYTGSYHNDVKSGVWEFFNEYGVSDTLIDYNE